MERGTGSSSRIVALYSDTQLEEDCPGVSPAKVLDLVDCRYRDDRLPGPLGLLPVSTSRGGRDIEYDRPDLFISIFCQGQHRALV